MAEDQEDVVRLPRAFDRAWGRSLAASLAAVGAMLALVCFVLLLLALTESGSIIAVLNSSALWAVIGVVGGVLSVMLGLVIRRKTQPDASKGALVRGP